MKITISFQKASAADAALADYYETINPYIIFWEECVEYDSKSTSVTPKMDVYRTFINWCKSNNHINLSKVTPKKFWYDFNALIKHKKLTPIKYKKSNGKRYVIGITLKDSTVRCVTYNPRRTHTVEEELDCGDIDYMCDL